MVCARQDWLEAMGRNDATFYNIQVKKAVDAYKLRVNWTDKPTVNIVGYDKFIDSQK